MGLLRRNVPRDTEKAPLAYATPRSEGLTSNAPSEVVQIDTMDVHNGQNRFLYQINATCIYSKLSVAHVFEAHTVNNSAYLLKKLLQRVLFDVQAVQIDQGTGFMVEFEETCKEKT